MERYQEVLVALSEFVMQNSVKRINLQKPCISDKTLLLRRDAIIKSWSLLQNP